MLRGGFATAKGFKRGGIRGAVNAGSAFVPGKQGQALRGGLRAGRQFGLYEGQDQDFEGEDFDDQGYESLAYQGQDQDQSYEDTVDDFEQE
jgi:hypothetical protein